MLTGYDTDHNMNRKGGGGTLGHGIASVHYRLECLPLIFWVKAELDRTGGNHNKAWH